MAIVPSSAWCPAAFSKDAIGASPGVRAATRGNAVSRVVATAQFQQFAGEKAGGVDHGNSPRKAGAQTGVRSRASAQEFGTRSGLTGRILVAFRGVTQLPSSLQLVRRLHAVLGWGGSGAIAIPAGVRVRNRSTGWPVPLW